MDDVADLSASWKASPPLRHQLAKLEAILCAGLHVEMKKPTVPFQASSNGKPVKAPTMEELQAFMQGANAHG